MNRDEEIASSLMEQLADIEHQRWSAWHEHAEANRNHGNVERWNRLAKTPYAELSEHSKESDRREVRRYLPLVVKAIESVRAECDREKMLQDSEHAEDLESRYQSYLKLQAKYAELSRQNAELVAMVKELQEKSGYWAWATDVETSGGRRTREFISQHRSKCRYWVSEIKKLEKMPIPDPSILEKYVEKAVKPLVDAGNEMILELNKKASWDKCGGAYLSLTKALAQFTKSEGGK